MTAGDTGGVATTGTVDPRRPAFVELFFDLVFVVALIELEAELADQLTWAGAGQTLVLLLAFMLIWGLAAWIAHSVNVGHPNFLPAVVVAMAGNLLLAATLSEAYTGRGLLFAGSYVAIQLLAGAWLIVFAREKASRVRTGRILVWEAATGVLWIIGGLVAGTARGVLWAVAIAIEYAAVALGWPTPGLGRARSRDWALVGERIVERYRQFVIIALGVSIFVVATTFAAENYPRDRIGALAVILVINVLMWRIYIGRGGDLLTTAIAHSGNPSRLSQVAAAHHLVIVAGIVAASVMGDLVVSQPFGDTPANWAAVMVAGPVLFLIGRGLFDYLVFRRFLRSRWIGLILLIAPAATAGLLPPIGLAVLIVLILALIASLDLVAIRRRPLPALPPGT